MRAGTSPEKIVYPTREEARTAARERAQAILAHDQGARAGDPEAARRRDELLNAPQIVYRDRDGTRQAARRLASSILATASKVREAVAPRPTARSPRPRVAAAVAGTTGGSRDGPSGSADDDPDDVARLRALALARACGLVHISEPLEAELRRLAEKRVER